MKFDPLYQPYSSNRYCITAKNGVVATGSGLAASAGLSVLRRGGNAVDAAVACAAALTVVEPTANGLGSDAFALVWMKDRLYGLNASGPSPYGISLEDVRRRSTESRMPVYGWVPVTVPGAVGGWAALVERFGKLTLAEDLAPAIEYAEQGYPLSPQLAFFWERAVTRYTELFRGKHEYDEWFRTFTKNGESYHFGETVKLPGHARTLKLIAESDGEAFYKGEIAEQLVKQSARDGGYFRMEDLADYRPEWVEPVCVNYRGYDVWEIPPNGQGITALMALNILKEFRFAERDAEMFHRQIEAMKLSFADSMHYVTDARHMNLEYHDLLDPAYGARRARLIGSRAEIRTHGTPDKSGTAYLCTADKEGNMVSFIQSNYMGFGSGIVVEGYGTALQNRGSDFSLDEGAVNVLAPHKKTYHTIIPGFLTKDGKASGPFGVMGGYMQPQGHVQTVMNLIDFGLNPQMALDAPRWQWIRDNKVLVEPGFSPEILEALKAKGHDAEQAENRNSFGRGQIILRLENGVYAAGTESRTDSNIAFW